MKRRPDHKYDGEYKYKTKNCGECEFKVDFYEREICGWGRHFQYLVEREIGARKCEYFGKEPPKNNSLNYVLEAKKHNLFGRSKGSRASQGRLFF